MNFTPLKRSAPTPVKPVTIPAVNHGCTSISSLVLPTQPTCVTPKMETSSWLIYGMKRIGKSSLAAKFPGSLVFKFEIASQRIMSTNVDCPSWEHFLRYIELLKTEKIKEGANWKRKVAVIDTPYEAYARCKEYVCKQNGIKYTSEDRAHGGIWDKITGEFRRAHMELGALGLGLVLVCHDTMKELTTRSGQKYDVILPKLSTQADDLYRAIVENVIYYHYRDKHRWLAIRGSDYIFANVGGDADSPSFLTPTGEKIFSVYAGDNADEAYENLKNAFECRQEETYEDESQQFENESLVASIRDKALKSAKKR